jgi:hypothetical protein
VKLIESAHETIPFLSVGEFCRGGLRRRRARQRIRLVLGHPPV